MSTTPNEWLSNLYDTGDHSQEKIASAQDAQEAELWELFKAAAAEDGIDADQLDDDQVAQLSQHYINESGDGGQQDEGGDLPPNWDDDDVDHFNSLGSEQEKQAFVQFKEADLVGKIMAHSMFSEMDKLALVDANKINMGEMGDMVVGPMDVAKGVGKAGLLAAGGYGAYRGGKALLAKHKARKAQAAEKNAYVIEQAAQERALNFLKEAGYDVGDDFDLADITEDQADELADERAMEILKEAGYIEKEAMGNVRATYQALKEGPAGRQALWEHGVKPNLTAGNAAKAVGGLAAAGGLAYGAKKIQAKRQEEAAAKAEKNAFIIESAAMDRARAFLKEAGIDPDSGEEFGGGDEIDLSEITEDDASQLADMRAEEILKEAGWLQ